MGKGWLGALGALALGLATASSAQAAIIVLDFESYPLGPISFPFTGSTPTSSTSYINANGTIVDTGGGNQAFQLNGSDPRFFFTFVGLQRLDANTAEQRDLISFDVFVDASTLVFGQTAIGGQWTTIFPTLPPGGNFQLQIGQGGLPPGRALIDNLSIDIVGTTPAPEPGVWAMMITGFGMIGAMLRRKRRRLTGAHAAA